MIRHVAICGNSNRRRFRPSAGGLSRAVTLVEVLVTTAIIVIIFGVVTLAFRKLADTSAVTTAVSTLTTYASVARAYAQENNVETLMVVNPVNGRLELWHEDPAGFDPYSQQYVPFFDSTVTLPLDSNGKPLVVVHPIDFNVLVDGTTRLRDTVDDPQGRNRDNMNWVAVAFDPEGRLVSRMHRFATRVDVGNPGTPYIDRYGRVSNRRVDGMPDYKREMPTMYAIDGNDSLIATTRGFIVSDRPKFQAEVRNTDPPPADVVTFWLNRLRTDAELAKFAREVVLNPNSGRDLVSEIR